MSVPYGKILAMEKWNKHTYVCGNCDSLLEITTTHNELETYCICAESDLTLLSVVDATIYPTQQKEEQTMETITEPQTMTLTWLENDESITRTYTENDIRSMVWNNKRLNEKMNEQYRKESQLRTLLEEVYADSSEQETLGQIAEIFDVPLTKEITVTAWVRVEATVEVDMADGDYDVESFVTENIYVDSNDSAINIQGYDVERVEED